MDMKRLLLWLWKVLPFGRRPQTVALWLLNRKFIVGVIGVVVDGSGRVLLLKHYYRNEYPWGLPSGWVKRGEQPGEAMRRELREEVGLEAKVVSVLETRADPSLPRLDITFLLRAGGPASGPRPLDVEITDAGFFRPGEFPGELPDPQPELVRKGLAQLGF
jgi:ADP-ribose pyrophosphatase YjhB (NUDIX family)